MQNSGIDDGMNALARQMCVKYESLAGDLDAFNSTRVTYAPNASSGFRLGIDCCSSRGVGTDGGG